MPAAQGWTSTSDPLSNRNGLAYEVIEPKVMRRQTKSYGDNFRYWGRVVNHHTKTDPRQMHGIDATIKDQAILTNADKLSPETANSSVYPTRQPELAADPPAAPGSTAGKSGVARVCRSHPVQLWVARRKTRPPRSAGPT